MKNYYNRKIETKLDWMFCPHIKKVFHMDRLEILERILANSKLYTHILRTQCY